MNKLEQALLKAELSTGSEEFEGTAQMVRQFLIELDATAEEVQEAEALLAQLTQAGEALMDYLESFVGRRDL